MYRRIDIAEDGGGGREGVVEMLEGWGIGIYCCMCFITVAPSPFDAGRRMPQHHVLDRLWADVVARAALLPIGV